MSTMGRHHPLWTLTAAFVLVALGLILLTLGVPGVGLWLVLYGGGIGIYSIARGTLSGLTATPRWLDVWPVLGWWPRPWLPRWGPSFSRELVRMPCGWRWLCLLS
jgi:hypothetical protein